MTDLKKDIISQIDSKVKTFQSDIDVVNIGRVLSLGDGVVTLDGLSSAKFGEVVEFENGSRGVIMNLKKDEVGVITFGEVEKLKEGQTAKSTNEILSVRVSDSYFGRVIDPLGDAIDGKGAIKHKKNSKNMLVEKIAPGIVYREPVDTPLQTGIKAIDTMIPIGRGQRELIVGDRGTGKTALVIDTIINQANLNKKKSKKRVICIYVAIGQKQSKIAQLVNKLEEEGAMDETIVISASSSGSAALQYIAPYVGCAIAEFFMENGEDVLIAYDDLSKHAWAYRQISLILRRPSGREAYPGDIFYLHSRLLERACKLSKKHGGGSITALPIIETQAQDISAYIPTNVVSITDGQIYLESDLFFQGVRPAINPGLSVSRVGGAAQIKAVKQVSGKLRLELASYNELSAFVQFGSDLDASSQAKIERGKRIVEVLKQPQYKPVGVSELTLTMWLVTKGYLDQVNPEDCSRVASDFVRYALTKNSKLESIIESKKGLDEKTEKDLEKLASAFMKLK